MDLKKRKREKRKQISNQQISKQTPYSSVKCVWIIAIRNEGQRGGEKYFQRLRNFRVKIVLTNFKNL